MACLQLFIVINPEQCMEGFHVDMLPLMDIEHVFIPKIIASKLQSFQEEQLFNTVSAAKRQVAFFR